MPPSPMPWKPMRRSLNDARLQATRQPVPVVGGPLTEHLDAVVAGIHHDDRPIRAHGHAERGVELLLRIPEDADAEQEGSRRTEELDPVVVRARYHDRPARAYGDAARLAELPL